MTNAGMNGIMGVNSASAAAKYRMAGTKNVSAVSVKGSHIQVSAEPVRALLEGEEYQGAALELSEEYSKYTEEELAELKKQKAEESFRESIQEQMESAREAAEGTGEGFEDMARALEIARRLMNGDRVPGSDEKFLMDFNKDMYMQAKSMQLMSQNEDSKDYDSILEDEEEGGNGSVSVDGEHVTIGASKVNLCQNMQKTNATSELPTFTAII